MAARKRTPAARAAKKPDERFLGDLHHAGSLMLAERWAEAVPLLESLAERDPGHADVLSALLYAYTELDDMSGVQWTGDRLLQVLPHDPDVTLALAGASLIDRPALALHSLQDFLKSWPEHDQVPAVQGEIAALRAGLAEVLAELDMPAEEGVELLARHDRVQVLVERSRFADARAASEQLLRRWPDFVPTLNNLSLIQAVEGLLESAVATARRVLALHPENCHALANLTHYTSLLGRSDEAEEWSARLKAVPTATVQVALKKAEALTYAGDDPGVLQAFEDARRVRERGTPAEDGLLHHLAAVATLRLGQESKARRLWRQAQRLAPDLELVQANLNDLRNPPDDRHVPWGFSLANWMPMTLFHELGARIERLAASANEEKIAQAIQRFLRDHPVVASLIPVLLDRGDPLGREFALRIALAADGPEMAAVLRDFALGQRGPREMRFSAAQAARDAGLIPAGPMRLWIQGEWQEVTLAGFEVRGEPRAQHPPRVMELADRARHALRAGKAEEAEAALLKALDLAPNAPDLLNNLACAYQLQGREEEGARLFQQIHAAHPDYLFGRIGMANLALQRGDTKAARAFLEPLQQRRQFHFSEFAALCQTQMQLFLTEGNPETAREWLAIWESMDPDHPRLASWRSRLGPRGRGRRPRGGPR